MLLRGGNGQVAFYIVAFYITAFYITAFYTVAFCMADAGFMGQCHGFFHRSP